MKIELIMLLISSVVFLSYLTYVVVKVGVLPSISDSWYSLNKTFLFTLFIWGTAFPLMLATDKSLLILSGASLCFVGTAAAFKESLTKIVHTIGAILSGTLALTSSLFEFHSIIMCSIVFSWFLLLAAIRVKNRLWWTEIICFVSVYIVLYTNI